MKTSGQLNEEDQASLKEALEHDLKIKEAGDPKCENCGDPASCYNGMIWTCESCSGGHYDCGLRNCKQDHGE